MSKIGWFADTKKHCIRAGIVIKRTQEEVVLYVPSLNHSTKKDETNGWEHITLPVGSVFSRTEEAVRRNGSPFDPTWSIIDERGRLIWDGKKARGISEAK